MKGLEDIARERCARILTTKVALELPPGIADALVTLGFMYGAAWALGADDAQETADAIADSLRSTQQ